VAEGLPLERQVVGGMLGKTADSRARSGSTFNLGETEMKWAIACLALLAIVIVVAMVSRLPSETAIRLAGYAATAAFAALLSFLIRWRARRAQRNKRAG